MSFQLQLFAPPEVCLDEASQRVSRPTELDEPRGSPRSALESIADHTGAAADAALVDRPFDGVLDCREHVLITDVKSVDIVQITVVSFAGHRQHPVIG